VLYDDLGFVWKAFFDLSRARPSGFGPATLRISDMLAWMTIHQLPSLQRAEFFELISSMDDVWMEWANNEQERKRGNSKTPD
jgi:hypothetical protein